MMKHRIIAGRRRMLGRGKRGQEFSIESGRRRIVLHAFNLHVLRNVFIAIHLFTHWANEI